MESSWHINEMKWLELIAQVDEKFLSNAKCEIEKCIYEQSEGESIRNRDVGPSVKAKQDQDQIYL